MNDLFRIAFTGMRCKEQTDDGGNSDEPYAVFLSADLQAPVPKMAMFRTRVFQDVDDQENRKQNIRIWGVNQEAQRITDPSKVILLAAVMENDDCQPDQVMTLARAFMLGNLLAFASAGYTRSEMVSKLISAFNQALDIGKKLGIWNYDGRLGTAKELSITTADLQSARKCNVDKHLNFDDRGGNDDLDGRYRLDFAIAAGAS
jgi:hypothetical protein